MPDHALTVDPASAELRLSAVFSDTGQRKQFVLLHTLVIIVLCYQLLFSEDKLLSAEVKEFAVSGLMLFLLGVFFLPARMWERGWPVVTLVLGDTAVGAAVLYLSGNTGSALYISYFLVMLIAAFAPTLKQMIGLSVILCAAYGTVLYLDSLETGLLSEGRLIGLTVLLMTSIFYGATTETVRKEKQRLAGLLVEITALKQLEEELKDQSGVDWLTALANRRRFDELFTQEWGRTRREGAPLAVLMMDIDDFKAFNDTYGHQAGDHCLQRVARAIKGTVCRPGDVVARYGGEEFVVLLPKTDAKNAAMVAESMRANVEALNIPHINSRVTDRVTVSTGVAALIPTQDAEPGALINFADQALYQAKREGRNRVISNGVLEQAS